MSKRKEIKALKAENAQLKADLNPCCLEKPPFYQCCCNCKWLGKLNLHCQNVIDRGDVKGCICGIQVGWVCLCHLIERSPEELKEHPVVTLHDGEHSGGCELYDPIDPRKGRQ